MAEIFQRNDLKEHNAEIRRSKHEADRSVVSFRIDKGTAAEWNAYCKIQSLYFNLIDDGSRTTVQKMDKGDLTGAALSEFMSNNPIKRKVDQRLFKMQVDRTRRGC